jgi:hypothetical protein
MGESQPDQRFLRATLQLKPAVAAVGGWEVGEVEEGRFTIIMARTERNPLHSIQCTSVRLDKCQEAVLCWHTSIVSQTLTKKLVLCGTTISTAVLATVFC